jgi:triosephosphate isomerase
MIGSGQAVSPDEVEHTHLVIRQALFDTAYENRWPDSDNIVRKNIKLIYGGSVNEENIKNFVAKDAIEGVLVGSAGLKAKEIFDLISAIKPVSKSSSQTGSDLA